MKTNAHNNKDEEAVMRKKNLLLGKLPILVKEIKCNNFSQNLIGIIKVTMILFLSIFISLLLDFTLIYFIIINIANYYDTIHPPIAGEDDLGFGFIMMIWFVIVSLMTIPLVIFFTLFFKRVISKHF